MFRLMGRFHPRDTDQRVHGVSAIKADLLPGKGQTVQQAVHTRRELVVPAHFESCRNIEVHSVREEGSMEGRQILREPHQVPRCQIQLLPRNRLSATHDDQSLRKESLLDNPPPYEPRSREEHLKGFPVLFSRQLGSCIIADVRARAAVCKGLHRISRKPRHKIHELHGTTDATCATT